MERNILPLQCMTRWCLFHSVFSNLNRMKPEWKFLFSLCILAPTTRISDCSIPVQSWQLTTGCFPDIRFFYLQWNFCQLLFVLTCWELYNNIRWENLKTSVQLSNAFLTSHDVGVKNMFVCDIVEVLLGLLDMTCRCGSFLTTRNLPLLGQTDQKVHAGFFFHYGIYNATKRIYLLFQLVTFG